MQPPILPIQHSDIHQAHHASAVQPIKSEPATANSTPLLINSLVILFVLSAFGAIVYRKHRAERHHRQIRRLEQLWQLESHSPFEEHQ